MSFSKSFKVAVVWRGDAKARAEARGETCRLKAVFGALAAHGIAAEPAVFCEAAAPEVLRQLLAVDGVLVWVDPIATATGQRRAALDDLLRQVAEAGVFVSTHPDVTAKMGVKAVLHRTRSLGWGSDTSYYRTPAAFEAEFPGRVASGPRVLKQNRGNGGIGVWKVEASVGGDVQVLEARGEDGERTLPLAAFIAERLEDFDIGGGLVDQPFQARLLDGMVRCYMSGGQVVGFGHQVVRALAPLDAGPAGPRLYSGADDVRFQRLRGVMDADWTPGLARLLDIAPADRPVI
ncbi:MAG: Cj0069 family protein, partial [Phenylobacterium sp.]